MKKGKKLGLLSAVAVASIINPMMANAESSVMPEPNADGIIQLTEDVTLTNYVINKGQSVKIDLNGHTLKRATETGYLLNNDHGELHIIDSSNGKGKIVCESEKVSSCIRNYNVLSVDGVTIESGWTALKNEEGSTMSVKNTKIKTTSGTAGAIINYGDLTVENSDIAGSNEREGAAIFALTYTEGDKVYSSTATIKNSNLSAYWPFIIEHSEPDDEGTVTVNFENGTIKQVSGIARIEGKEARSTNQDFNLTLKGDITASSEALEYIDGNATLTLNEDLKGDITVPEGLTLVIPEGVNVGENKILVEEGAVVKNETSKNITVVLLGEEETEIEIEAGMTSEEPKKEEPAEPTTPEEPKDENPTEPTTPEEPKNEESSMNVPETNPKTLDGVYGYAAIGLASLGSLVAVLKKKNN